jgi:hypothetical protein
MPELETERLIQQIERGTWVPPRLQPREDRLEDAMAALGVQVDETFRVFAKRWWRSKELGLDDDTQRRSRSGSIDPGASL